MWADIGLPSLVFTMLAVFIALFIGAVVRRALALLRFQTALQRSVDRLVNKQKAAPNVRRRERQKRAAR